MEHLKSYIKPELIIVAFVLYFLGSWLKEAAFFNNKYIPIVLGVFGILICGIWVFATSTFVNAQDIALGVFTSLVQGVLVAGLSTYVNQIIKQCSK